MDLRVSCQESKNPHVSSIQDGAEEIKASGRHVNEMSLPEAALFYASIGLKVHPLHDAGTERAKEPRLPEWQKKATNDVRQIREWWTRWPNSNIGILTGKDGRVDVFDGDNKEACKWIEAHCPITAHTVRTTKGKHYYFRAMENTPNTVSRLFKGVDTRGVGGFIVAPPSIHPSGEAYQWECNMDTLEGIFAHKDDGGLVEAGEHLFADLKKEAERRFFSVKEYAKKGNDRQIEAYFNKAWEELKSDLSNATEGCRNSTLNAVAYRLGRLIAGQLCAHPGECLNELRDIALNLPGRKQMTRREVYLTINSGFEAGKKSPFHPELREQTKREEPTFTPPPIVKETGKDYPLNLPQTRRGNLHEVMAEMAALWGESYRLIDGQKETMIGLHSGKEYGTNQTKRMLKNAWTVFIKDESGKENIAKVTWNDAINAVMPYEAYCRPRWVYTQKPLSLYRDSEGNLYFNRCKPLARLGTASKQDVEFGERVIEFVRGRFKTEEEANYWLNWLLDARTNTSRKPGVINNYRAIETGTGKNTLGTLIPRMFVGTVHCGEQVGQPTRFALENPLETLLFAMYDETWQDSKGYSRLKSLATASPVLIEFKGKTAFTSESSTRISTGSNEKADFIEDAEDRRANMFELTNKIQYAPIIDEIKAIVKDENSDKSANARAGFMLALERYCKEHEVDILKSIDTELKRETHLTSVLSKPEVGASLNALGEVPAGLTPEALAKRVSEALHRPITARALGYALRGLPDIFVKQKEGARASALPWKLTDKGHDLYKGLEKDDGQPADESGTGWNDGFPY